MKKTRTKKQRTKKKPTKNRSVTKTRPAKVLPTMRAGDLYVTPTKQRRLIIGTTPTGDIAFATRGEQVIPDYSNCQIQPPDTFAQEGLFEKSVSAAELARVREKFANYRAANGIL